MKAVCLTLGTIFPTDGPGLSAFISCIVCPPASGTMAIRKTRTPIPPIQWVKLRQKSAVLERASMLVSMLAPVVEKPDAVSKTASIYEGISPEI